MSYQKLHKSRQVFNKDLYAEHNKFDQLIVEKRGERERKSAESVNCSFVILLILQERGVQQNCAAQDVISCGARRRVSVQTAHVQRISGLAQWWPQVIDYR